MRLEESSPRSPGGREGRSPLGDLGGDDAVELASARRGAGQPVRRSLGEGGAAP